MKVELTNKYVIGTHVMWFEIEMFTDFIDGMINLMETVEDREKVTIDLCFNLSQKLEKIDKTKILIDGYNKNIIFVNIYKVRIKIKIKNRLVRVYNLI